MISIGKTFNASLRNIKPFFTSLKKPRGDVKNFLYLKTLCQNGIFN